jgi:nicotinamide-nucleotide amidase
MRCALLSVGTELLFGQIVNTNAVYLSRELNAMGIDVMFHHSVGDNSGRLKDLMISTFKEVDLIITTGGLGPTEDDLTKETAAEVFGVDMVTHEPSLKYLEEYGAKRHRKMTPNNYKQAIMPKGADVFDNPAGTAPGFALSKNGKIIICMPGPPREMTRMWKDHAKPFLMKYIDGTIFYTLIKTFGIGESRMETVLLNLIDHQTDPTIATYAHEGECSLRIASKRHDEKEARAAVKNMALKVADILGDTIYSFEGLSMPEAVGGALIKSNLSISACESCTGGLFSSMLVNVPGISAVFDRGLVTYSIKAKIEELGVNPETIEAYKAESAETAYEMAEGLYRRTGSDICVASTGVSGPGPYHGLEAGTMFVGLHYKGKTRVRKIVTARDERKWNRYYCCLVMLDEIRKAVGIVPEINI